MFRSAAARVVRRGMGAAKASPTPLALVVRVEIEEARVPEFLQVMAVDCEGSRKEKGCLRFDLLRDKEKPNAFVFYEVYEDEAAVDDHKTQEHYKAWADFKARGGVVSQTTFRMDAVDFTQD